MQSHSFSLVLSTPVSLVDGLYSRIFSYRLPRTGFIVLNGSSPALVSTPSTDYGVQTKYSERDQSFRIPVVHLHSRRRKKVLASARTPAWSSKAFFTLFNLHCI